MIEAVVRTGATQTRYRRTGRGPQLVLLATGAQTEWLEALVPPLAQRFRLFLPEAPSWLAEAPPHGSNRAAGWLREVIDGLGLDRPGVVVGPDLAAPLARFLESDADRVDRLAFLHATPMELAISSPSARVFPVSADERGLGALLAFLDPTT